MTLELPNQFHFTLRLLRALHGDGDERDTRIARLALTHLDPDHREHFLSRAVSQDELWELEQEHGHKRAYKSLTRNSLVALRVVFWKLGIITDPGPGHQRRARRCPLVIGLMDKHLGSDPTQSEFACLACGNPVHVPVGKKGKFTCSTCGHRYRLSHNDGRRIAFPKPKVIPLPLPKLKPPAPESDRGSAQVMLAGPLHEFITETARLLQLPPAPPSKEFTQLYRSLLLEYPADKPRTSDSAMNDIAKALWATIEERCP